MENEELTLIQPYLIMVNGEVEEVAAFNENAKQDENVVVIKSLGNGTFAVKYPKDIMFQRMEVL